MTAPRCVTIGNAQLWLGDCRDVVPVLRDIGAVVTDPPYGISHCRGTCGNRPNGRHSGYALTRGTFGIIGDDRPFDPAQWLQWPCVLWGANYFAADLPRGRWLVWDKIEHGGSGDFSDAELAWCSESGATRTFRHMWMGVQRASQCGDARLHPTEKPIALMEWCLSFMPPGTVLDPFAGSGTTGVACARLGRAFIGIECHEPYFDIAVHRITEAQRQGDMLRDLLPPVAEPPEDARLRDLFSTAAA